MGRLTSVSTSAGVSTNYTGYGVQGDILFSNQVTNGKTYKFSYGVAMNSNLLQVNYPSTRAVNLAYGNANEPISVGGTYNNVTTAYIGFINFLGLQETLRAYGGSGYYIWGRTLNNRGQVTNLQLNNWDSPNNSYDYTGLSQYFNYGTSNNNGNLLGSTEYNSPGKSADPGLQLSPAINQSYSYDGVNRLSGVTDNGYSRSYCYDAFGNGWVTASSGQNLAGNTPQDINETCTKNATAPYNPSNQLNGNMFDAAGNQITFGGNKLGYDAENRVVSVTAPSNAVLASIVYDGDGRRVSKTTSSGTTTYVYDAFGRLSEEYLNGVLQKDYIWMHSEFVNPSTELVAVENMYAGAACTTCFLLTDDLGSVRIVADLNGNYISRHDYLPFGEEAASGTVRPTTDGFDAPDTTTQRFTGKERDSESGLDYFWARYYGSALGRFTSADEPFVDQQPQDPQSWNLYAYVRNNPLKNTDPSGLDCITTSQSSSGLTVTTERGGSADPCSGTYVDGTVDVNSYSYNGSSLSWSDNSANLGGAINFISAAQPDDVLSPGVANMLHNAGTQASQGTIAFVGAEALFATSYGATYALPALYSALAVGGEAGALYVGRGLQLTRDATGKVHGDLPKFVPQGASREQLEEAAQELQKSIEVRAQELIRLGEEGAHRARIEQERDLLRQIEKKLGGS